MDLVNWGDFFIFAVAKGGDFALYGENSNSWVSGHRVRSGCFAKREKFLRFRWLKAISIILSNV